MFEKLLERFSRARRGGAGVFSLPEVIFEIQPGFVAGARLNNSARGPRQVQRVGQSDLASGALQVLFNRPNISDLAEIQRAIRDVANVVGNGNRRIGLLIPDGIARVGMLSFETLPDNQKEAEALVRWKMKDMLPFPAEEARTSYQVLRRGQSSIELLAAAIKASVLSEYESALEPIDISPALILPATLALLPMLPKEDATGQLLVHVCCGWMTAVVVLGAEVCLWRVRRLGQGETTDLASEVAPEIARVLAGSGDYLKVAISQIWLCVRPPDNPELIPELTRKISREVKPLVPQENLAAGLPPEERALFERFGASVAGLVYNAG